MARFSKNVLKKLREAGWRQNRRTNVDEVLEAARKAGCSLTPSMIDFLQEFQGLKLVYRNGEELFDFEPYLHSINKENCDRLLGEVGEQVFKVGVMYNSNLLVVISESGKMYALTSGEHDIFMIGEHFDEGIEFICTHGLGGSKNAFESKRVK